MPRKRIHPDLDLRVRAAARQRCGYCLSPQRLVMARLEVEHLISVRSYIVSRTNTHCLGTEWQGNVI
jgi:hypothetical protein